MLLSCLYITQGNNLRSLQPELACDGLQAGNLVVFLLPIIYLPTLCTHVYRFGTKGMQSEAGLHSDLL